ncbi:glycosyltransferase [Burkholderiales bacterium]|nr:glycosyltransferase [Burkholderiales bacterium]
MKDLAIASHIDVPSTSGQRILLVGDYMWPWYQDACADALERQGSVVARFGWLHDFHHFVEGISEPQYHSLWHRIQYRLRLGPGVWRVNRRLTKIAQQFSPDIVWFYNVTLISPATVKKLRKICPSALFVQYANDNPFSKTAKPGLWRNYLASIPYFDIHSVFRHSNILDYQTLGSQNVITLRSYFIPEVDYPEIQAVIPARFKCDVVFAGHYEDDGRVAMLEAICNAGYKLNLFGGGWAAALPKLKADSPLKSLFPVTPVTGADYRYAICGAKVALCFLSKLNNDTYTTRNFQIPAMKTTMLSQYTVDLASMFIPDVEAVFFSNQQELLTKLHALIQDDERRTAIAEAGYERVYGDGHDVRARMNAWLKEVLITVRNPPNSVENEVP